MAKKQEQPAGEPEPRPMRELRPEGSEEGGAEVGVARRTGEDGKEYFQQYHLERDGKGGLRKVYHDVPPGFVMDENGRLTPTGD